MDWKGKISLSILVMVLMTSMFSSLITVYDPDAIDLDSLRQPPSLRHPLGTDSKGRDIFARVLYGGKISIGISFVSAMCTMVIGLGVGLIAGYYGGRLDMLCMMFVDIVLAFPSMLLAIGISLLFQPGILTVMIALSVVGWASVARIIRGYVLTIKESSFISAAEAIGCNDLRIILVHIMPQCIPLVFVLSGLKIGGFLLTESALSFLGLGVQPPTASWGAMISVNRGFIYSFPWMVIGPGMMLSVSVLCFNTLGDSLREKLRVGRSEIGF